MPSSPNPSITEIESLQIAVQRGDRIIALDGLTSTAAKAYVLSKLASSGRTIVVVTDTNASLDDWEGDLEFWTRDHPASILSLPSFETDVYSGSSPHAETLERRALSLWHLSQAQPSFLLLSARSLVSRTVSPKDLVQLGAHLKVDEDSSPDDLVERLASSGYVREDPIGGVGQFSVRGGILDVWSPDSEFPVRVEFFGDTVDSIRVFDPETQLSTERLKEVSIAPMREFAATEKDFRDWSFFAREKFDSDMVSRSLRDRTDFSDEGESFTGWEFLLPLVKPLEATVFDYLGDAVFIIDEPTLIENALSALYDNLKRRHASLAETGEIGLEPKELFLEADGIRTKLAGPQRIELRALGKSAAATDEDFAGIDLAFRIERIGLDQRGAGARRVCDRGLDQRPHQPLAALGARDDEAGQRPDRRVVDRGQDPRAAEPVLRAARGDAAPADRRARAIGEDARLAAVFDQRFQKSAVVVAETGPEVAVRPVPEGAPALARIAAAREQGVDVGPALGRGGMEAEVGPVHGMPLCS